MRLRVLSRGNPRRIFKKKNKRYMISFLEKGSLTKNKLLIPFNASGKNIGSQFKGFFKNLMPHGLTGLIRYEFVRSLRSYNLCNQTRAENLYSIVISFLQI